jgi:hypothetical protein
VGNSTISLVFSKGVRVFSCGVAKECRKAIKKKWFMISILLYLFAIFKNKD